MNKVILEMSHYNIGKRNLFATIQSSNNISENNKLKRNQNNQINNNIRGAGGYMRKYKKY